MEEEETTLAVSISALAAGTPSLSIRAQHIEEEEGPSGSSGASIIRTSNCAGGVGGSDVDGGKGETHESINSSRPRPPDPPKSILRRGKHGSARAIATDDATADDEVEDDDKRSATPAGGGWGAHLVQNLISDTTAYLSTWTQPAEPAQVEAKGTESSPSDDKDSDSDSDDQSRPHRLPVRFAIQPPAHTSLIDFSNPPLVGLPTGSSIAASSDKSGHNTESEVDSTINSTDHVDGAEPTPSSRRRIRPRQTSSAREEVSPENVPSDYQEFLHQVHLEAIKMAEELRLLWKMLSERDERIASLADEIDSAREEKDNVDLQIDEAQRLLEEDSMTHRSTLEDYAADEEGCRHAMEQLEYEMKQSAKLFEYTKLLKEAATKRASARNGGGVQDSTYLIRLQSQLMKSMHSMGMLDNQLKLYQSQCSGMAKSLREEISRIVEEKSMAELRMMNELGSVHAQMKEREEELSGAVEAKRAELAKVEQILMERYGHHIDEDGNEDEENDESDSVGEKESSDPHDDEGVHATPAREGKPTLHADEETLLLDEEIERVQRQIQTLSTEKESMVEHLNIAIASSGN